MPHARRKSPTTLDPRGVLVFNTRALGRQPGAAREETRKIPAPENLRVELAEVPAEADVEMSVRLEAVTEGVLVTGTAAAPVVGECARCLEPLASSVEVGFQELYAYEPSSAEDDEDGQVLDGDLLDLEPVFRDAVVLALPLSPLCSDDCPGLCAQCGVRLAEAGPGHRHDDAVLPMWEALRQFDGFDTQDQTGRRNGAGNRQEG
ncbi:MAG TPA: YceD family protein [Streptosporangiaceae bacterium]|nr:YceD family protein [Streptosporangiaceae bacterium]